MDPLHPDEKRGDRLKKSVSHFRDYLLLLFAGFSFSSLAVFSELATRLSIDGFNQIVWRALFAMILSGIAAFLFYKQSIRLTANELTHMLVNGLLLAGGISTFSLGIYLGSPIAKAVALNYAYPLVVIVGSYLLFKEKPTVKGWVAVVISLVSVAILLEVWNIQNLFTLNIGDMLELLNSVFYGALIVYGKKISTDTNLHPLKSLFYSYLVATPCLFILGLFIIHVLDIPTIGTSLQWLTIPQNLTLLGLAAFGMVLPLALMYTAISRVKAYVAGILLLTEPLWVYIFGLLLFQQALSIWGLLGMLGIIIAVLLI